MALLSRSNSSKPQNFSNWPAKFLEKLWALIINYSYNNYNDYYYNTTTTSSSSSSSFNSSPSVVEPVEKVLPDPQRVE